MNETKVKELDRKLDLLLTSISETKLEITSLKNDLNNRMQEFTSQMVGRLEVQDKKIELQEIRTDQLVEELRMCKNQMEEQGKKIVIMENRVIAGESHSRRLNLILTNVPEAHNENIHEVIQKVFIKDLQINAEIVNSFIYRDYHRLGKMNSEGNRVRNIIIAFIKQNDRNYVFKQGKKLQGNKIAIRVDLPPEYSKIRDSLLTQRRIIKDDNKEAVAILSYRAYKPILLVKFKGVFQEYKDSMPLAQLETNSY